MRAILIGNSICNGLEQRGWDVIALPGADWRLIERYILDHISEFRNAFVYIHAGSVMFIRMNRGRQRREVSLVKPESRQSSIAFWNSLKTTLSRWGSVPVICTLYPMDFRKCNDYYANAFTSSRGYQLLQDSYDDWNYFIRGMVVIENRGIVAFNERNDVITPFLHRTVFIRRRGYFVFRSDRFLHDGIHPKPSLKNQWKRALMRAHNKNLQKWSMPENARP
jgi:hypothetical protein